MECGGETRSVRGGTVLCNVGEGLARESRGRVRNKGMGGSKEHKRGHGRDRVRSRS